MWSALGYDPVPGDPAAVRATADAFGRVEQDVEMLTARLGRIADADGTLWSGCAADLFADQLAELVPDLRKLSRSHGLARDALRGYATSLGTAQDLARRAGGAADDAAADRARADQDRDRADQDRTACLDRLRTATAAADRMSHQRAVTPDPVLAATLVAEEERHGRQAVAAQLEVRSATQRRDAAEAAEAAARARLEAARQLADDARELRADAGRTAARRLDEASDAGIGNRGALAERLGSVVDTVRRVTATDQFRDLLDLLDDAGGALTTAGALIGLVFPAAGVIIAGAGVGLLGVALAGRLLSTAVGTASMRAAGGALFTFGTSAFSVFKAAKAVKTAGGTFGGAIALGGEIKRSLAYDDNRTLSGAARKLLWETVPAAPKQAVPFASKLPAAVAERLEKPVYQAMTGYEVHGQITDAVELGAGVVDAVRGGVQGAADDVRDAARTVADGVEAIRTGGPPAKECTP